MTKNINYVSHKKSKVKNNGKPQLPSANSLVEGEIAINYAKDVETLSIKNESGTVVTFSSDNYYTEKKLGSGFTESNSAVTVTDAIFKVEKAISDEMSRATAVESALSSSKADKATTLAGYGITDAYTKSETYTKTEVNGMVDTPHQNYVTVATYADLPTTGSADTIYRVSNWDGSANSGAGAVDVTVYSEYAWDDVSNPNKYVFLCVKSQIGEVFDISVYNNNAKYDTLADALGTNGEHVPQSIRRGGMSVKYVQNSDKKYVQARCMAQNFTTNVTQWAIAEEGVYVENPEFVYVKADAEGKILWAVKADGGIYYGAGVPSQIVNYINEKIAELSLDEYEDIVAFLNGLEEGDKTLQDLLNEKVDKEEGKSLIPTQYIQETDNPEFIDVKVDSENKILEAHKIDGTKIFKTDVEVNGNVDIPAVSVNNIDNPEWLRIETDKDDKILGGRKIDGTAVEYMPVETPISEKYYIENPEFIDVKTDRDGKIIEGLRKDGSRYENSETKQYEDAIDTIMKAVANGGKDTKLINLLKNMPKGTYSKRGVGYRQTAFMSFHDDDTFDGQIPVSWLFGATPQTRANTRTGGFASFLYPFMKSITERHRLGKKLVPNATTKGYDLVDETTPNPIKGKLVYGLAAEGQRIGLTGLYTDVDEFDGELNLCGKIASKLHYKYGWDIMCHSMTARYIAYSYSVSSLNDPLVTQIEAAARKVTQNAWTASYIHCEDSNRDYEYRIDDNNHGEWHEVSDHYIRPYLAKSLDANAPLYFNPRYSEAYQVGEWKRRAEIAGLPFIDAGVKWGTSACLKYLLTDLEYITNWIAPIKFVGINNIPIKYSCFDRDNYFTYDTNKWDASLYDSLIAGIDSAIESGSWFIVAGHAYETVERNYYLDDVDYGERRCNTYNSEWEVPLKQEELESIDENNYWDVPPARLGISSWAEWYPCPGTTYDMLMNVIEYAISAGMEFGSTQEGLKRFSNIFNIGVKLDGVTEADKRLDISENDPAWNNYIIQGSDGSIDYNIV